LPVSDIDEYSENNVKIKSTEKIEKHETGIEMRETRDEIIVRMCVHDSIEHCAENCSRDGDDIRKDSDVDIGYNHKDNTLAHVLTYTHVDGSIDTHSNKVGDNNDNNMFNHNNYNHDNSDNHDNNDENYDTNIHKESNLCSLPQPKSLGEVPLKNNNNREDNDNNNNKYINPIDIHDNVGHDARISKINNMGEKYVTNDIEKNENDNEKKYENIKNTMNTFVQTYVPYIFCLYVGIFDGALLVPFKFSTKNNNDLLNVFRYLASFGIFSIIVSPIFFMIYCFINNLNDPHINSMDINDYKIPPFHVKAALLPGICQGAYMLHVHMFLCIHALFVHI
jgi:hypothetical protein